MGGSIDSNSYRVKSELKTQQGFISIGGTSSSLEEAGFRGSSSSHTLTGLLKSNAETRTSSSSVTKNSNQVQEPRFAFGRYSRSTALQGLTRKSVNKSLNRFVPIQPKYNVSGLLQDGREEVPQTVKSLDKDDNDKHAVNKQRRDNLKAFKFHVEEDNIKLRRGTSLSTDEIRQLERIKFKLENETAELKQSKLKEEAKGRKIRSFIQDKIKNRTIQVQTGFVESYEMYKNND